MAVVCTKCGLAIPSTKRKNFPICQKCEVYLKEIKVRENYRAKSAGLGHDWQYTRGKTWEKARFGEWLLMVKKVPKDYPRLTEAQWQKSLEYFNHTCAMCQENPVVARHYFVSVADGGMYCDWNVIPVCQHCISQSGNNPFRAMNRDTQRQVYSKANRRKYGKKKLKVILDYLTPLLLKAVRYGNSQQVPGTSNESVE